MNFSQLTEEDLIVKKIIQKLVQFYSLKSVVPVIAKNLSAL